MNNSWTITDAEELYNVEKWGAGYFHINKQGSLAASPTRVKELSIPLIDIVKEAQKAGYNLPLKIRFQDILWDRIKSINSSFKRAIKDMNYSGDYMGVFPIKVNQYYEVVEEIMAGGGEYNFGIEAGSKAELMAALCMHKSPESLIICNGYKDNRFITHALNGLKIGKKVILIAEKLEEVKIIIEAAKKMNVTPIIGFRARLSTKSSGVWATSGGDSAKFGLSTYDIVEAVALLEEASLIEAVELLHFHIGSQIPDIKVIGEAVREGARFYTKLSKLGCRLKYIDVGGGLGIDYMGKKSRSDFSTNYTQQEYANNIIYYIKDICDEEKVAHPTIISESGRSLVSHHSLIVTEYAGRIRKSAGERGADKTKEHKLITAIREIKEKLDHYPLLESFHDLQQDRAQAQSLFNLGYLDLKTKAAIENLYWQIAEEIVDRFNSNEELPEEIAAFKKSYADQYILNFSLFQSLPDYWAIGQIFPIMPIHRLESPPEIETALIDITCDSDGKINRFSRRGELRETVRLHSIEGDAPYYIAVFLTGAYQDTMGNLHNLFGRINEAHVYLDKNEEQGWYIENLVKGDTIADVLERNDYSKSDLVKRLKHEVDRAIKTDLVKPNEGMKLLKEFREGLDDYTYMTRKESSREL